MPISRGTSVLSDGAKCHPLTIVNAYSRFLIRCEGVEAPDGREVQRVFDSAFQRVWAAGSNSLRQRTALCISRAPAGSRKLSVWWLRLRHSPRTHRTWKAAAERATGAFSSIRSRRKPQSRHGLTCELSSAPSMPSDASTTKRDLTKPWGKSRPRASSRSRHAAIRVPLMRFEPYAWNQAAARRQGWLHPLEQQAPLHQHRARARGHRAALRARRREVARRLRSPFAWLAARDCSGSNLLPTRGRLADIEPKKVSGMSSD